MLLHNIINQSLQSLGSNRLRSVLTMLGVVWGTASVVFLLGWGQGFVEVMRTESRSVGDGFVMIWPKRARSEISGRRGARQLLFQLKDVDAVLAHCPSVRYATPVNGSHGLIMKAGNNLKSGTLLGVNPDAMYIFNLAVERGRFLHPEDLKQQRRVVVLGADLAEALFPPGLEVLGRRIKARGVTFEVIGVLQKKGDTLVDWGGRDDEKAYVPITTWRNISGWRYVSQIVIHPRDATQSEACIEEVRSVLARELDFSPEDTEALEIVDISSILLSLDTMAMIAAVFVTIIGVITLFVGGVGVMNIMLIGVTERTREIGIRKAIGAKRRHILTQFLAEAMTITILSGIIGILVGCAVSVAFAAVPRPKILAAPEISPLTIAASFLVMVLTGLLAGVMPARRAANMEPVESLRYE
ncbi:MAG: ABC transporter permease [Candidatus Abyssubacteria bacterium]